MQLRNIALCASALATPLVTGRSFFDFGQDVITRPNEPQTIAVQTEVSVSRPAETATLQLRVATYNLLEEAATLGAVRAVNQLESLCMELTSRHPPAVDRWSYSEIRVIPPKQHTDHQGMVQYDEDSDDSDHTVEYKAKTTFTIGFVDVDAVKAFVKNSTGATGVWSAKLQDIQWELTEDSVAELKVELKRSAIGNVTLLAEEYAAVFGTGIGRLLEFEQLWTYTGEKWRRGSMYWDWDMDDNDDLEPKEVQMEASVKGKFSTA